MKKFLKQDINNPKYLFHGSPKIIEYVEPRQAHDSFGNKENEDNAVFLTPSLIIASAYAFKDKIKENSTDLDWNFYIGQDQNGKLVVNMDNVRLDDEQIGYIYVFPFDTKYKNNGNTIQYKCYEQIKPINIVEVKFKDYKKYYSITNEVRGKVR